MNSSHLSMSYYLHRSQQFIWIILVTILFLVLGEGGTIYFYINHAQHSLIEFSLADSFLLLEQPYILVLVVTVPYLLIFSLLIIHDFHPQLIVAQIKRQKIWSKQMRWVRIISLIWIALSVGIAYFLTQPFVTESINWTSVTSYSFYQIGITVETSFPFVLIIVMVDLWLKVILLSIASLFIYWLSEKLVFSLLSVLLFSGMSFLPVFSSTFLNYGEMNDLKHLSLNLIAEIILIFMASFGISNSRVVTRKEFYGKED
ncbi:hypothetical protein IGI37_002722 [Enterococcus sp. AZ194]|uniref:hypothetical protein n=1 Tax=Enterococcus sp. AZ194 TaxID=2774629 RepID=UPI003F24A136